jgi:SAM-dependent methyltransferase
VAAPLGILIDQHLEWNFAKKAREERPRMFGWLMRKVHEPIYNARIRELVRQIVPWLKTNDRVLDVGCGFGTLGHTIMNDPNCPPGVVVSGLERVKREGELIEVDAYGGGDLPYESNRFDVVILADVLHHEADPDRLMDECARVAKRLLIIKDHKVDGPLAQQRISLIDWAANAPYGVPCLYRYNTPTQWRESHARHGFQVERELQTMHLYPPAFNLMFGRRLQYMAVLGTANS